MKQTKNQQNKKENLTKTMKKRFQEWNEKSNFSHNNEQKKNRTKQNSHHILSISLSVGGENSPSARSKPSQETMMDLKLNENSTNV